MSADGSAPATGFAIRRTVAPSGRIDSIQLLRAVAVLMVVLYHLTVLYPDPLAARWAVPAPLYFGYAGVDLFFLVSGFIIYHVTRREPFDVRSFALKRVFRILPLYWLVTSLILAIWFVRPDLVAIRADSVARYVVDSYLLIPTPERPLLGVGWTLQHEFQFYILMAVLLMLGARNAAVPVLMAMFAAGVVLRVVIDPGHGVWDWKILSLYTFQFALGIVAYRINARWRLTRPWMLILLGVALFVVTSSMATPLMKDEREVAVVTRGMFGLTRSVGYGLASFALMLGMLNLPAAQDLTGSRIGRTMLAIGDASFVIYLIHNLVLQAMSLGTRRIPESLAGNIAIALLGLGAVIVAGIIVHRIIERPLLRFLELQITPHLIGKPVDRLTITARSGMDQTS